MRYCLQKEDVMKRLFLGIVAIMMLTISGCGDVGLLFVVPVGTVINPPSITSYRFTKHTTTGFIDGSVDFSAPDSDIDTITVAVFDGRGFEIYRSKSVLNLPGVTHGTILFSIDYAAYLAGTYTFSIFLTDFNGNTSNQAVDTFIVP